MADEQLIIPARLQRTAAAVAEPASVEVVYVRHYRSVFRYVLGLTRSSDEAEEIAAETFERAVGTWGSRPPARGSEVAWLLLTARRLATDRWRRMRRQATLALRRGGAAALDGQRADAGEQRTEFWLWFEAVCEVLSVRQREVLLLRYQRDLSDADIGRVMGLSASGVRSLVARALDALRKHPELL